MRSVLVAVPPALLLALGILAPRVAAQGSSGGTFERLYPDAHRLLVTLEAVENVLLQKLVSDLQSDPTRIGHERAVREMARGMENMLHLMDPVAVPVGPLEREAAQDLLNRILARSTAATGPAVASDAGRRLAEIQARAQRLRRELLDLFADAAVTDRTAAARTVLEGYRGSAGSVAAVPQPMDAMFAHEQATTFQNGYSVLRGLLYAARWFEYAVFEPLFLLDTPEERQAGMQTVIDRFFQKLEAPENAPTELPMAPTIAPGLVGRSRPAAAALDNANMLYQVAADALLSPLVADKSEALARAIAGYTDADQGATDYDWILMANRHGIYNQGGPAIGVLDQSERNTEAHSIHRGMVLPGMPGG